MIKYKIKKIGEYRLKFMQSYIIKCQLSLVDIFNNNIKLFAKLEKLSDYKLIIIPSWREEKRLLAKIAEMNTANT